MTTWNTTTFDTQDEPMNAGEPTDYLLQLAEAGTPDARWLLGTEESGIGFFPEFDRPAAGCTASAEPDEDVADWVADQLGVTGVELRRTSEGWSVTLISWSS